MTTSPPVVSVILPTHNRAHLVGRAIRSVLAQTFFRWELLVVDDSSRDHTEEVVRAVADERIRYLRHAENRGVAAARNTGIRAAGPTGYLAFLDDDDEWLAHKLERQLEAFRTSDLELGAVGCGRVDYDGPSAEEFIPRVRGVIFEDLLARRARGYGAPLLLVRRFPSSPDVLFDERFPCLEDAEYVLRLARSHPLDFVPEPLVKVHRNDGGPHLWNPVNTIEGYRLLLEKYADDIAARPRILSFYQFCIARERLRLGDRGEARRLLKAALISSPTEWRLYVWIMACGFGRFPARVCGKLFPLGPPRAPGTVHP